MQRKVVFPEEHYGASDTAPVQPGKRGGRLCGNLVGDLIGEAFIAFGLSTYVILSLRRFSRQWSMPEVPGVVQVADDRAVIASRVDPGTLRDHRVVIEETKVRTVAHPGSWHRDKTPQHLPIGEYCTFGIALDHLSDDFGVEDLMARFVGRDLLADPREIPFPAFFGEAAEVSMS